MKLRRYPSGWQLESRYIVLSRFGGQTICWLAIGGRKPLAHLPTWRRRLLHLPAIRWRLR